MNNEEKKLTDEEREIIQNRIAERKIQKNVEELIDRDIHAKVIKEKIETRGRKKK